LEYTPYCDYRLASAEQGLREVVRHAAQFGVALSVVQLGGTPLSAKPWKGLGSGGWELVEKGLKQLLADLDFADAAELSAKSALDQCIDIVVKPARRTRAAGITVVR
jgi:hypothetical protein